MLVIRVPRVGPGCVLCPRIDPLRFLAWCRKRRLNQGLVDRACFCVTFFGLWVHALFSLLSFCYHYQCNWLPGKIRPRNDLLCVEWNVKPCSTQLNSTQLNSTRNSGTGPDWLIVYHYVTQRMSENILHCDPQKRYPFIYQITPSKIDQRFHNYL